MWEAGDEVIKRYTRIDEFQGRQYALNVIAKGKGPFLDLRRIAVSDGGWLLLYRADGCWDLETALKRGGNGREVFLPTYLKVMLSMLEAMKLAEEHMVSPSVFIVDASTVFYHGETDSVRFAYLPCQRREQTVGELMLEFLIWIGTIDSGFGKRWPILEKTFEEFRDARVGRHRLIDTLQQWKSEFPETKCFRKGM